MKYQNSKIAITLLSSVIFAFVFFAQVSAQTTKRSAQTTTKPSGTETDTTSTDKSTTTGTTTDASTSATTNTDVKSALSDYKKTAVAKRLEALEKVGNKMIDVRIKDKNNIKTRITNNKCLLEADKNTILADITKTVDGLTALKTKIDGATTIDELKPLVHSIRTDYRVYMVEIPREHGLVAVCRAEKAKIRFDGLVVKIQAEINKAKNDGKDTGAAQAKLDEAKVQLEEAAKQTATAREKFTAMKVENGDATNKEFRAAGHTALKAAHQALQNAKKLFVELKTDLRQLSQAATTPTSTTSTP